MKEQPEPADTPANPTSCNWCKSAFLMNYALQAETRHIAMTEGSGAAAFHVNDVLADYHGQHPRGREVRES